MHPLENELAALLREQILIMGEEMVLVAVSAGPDSTALLHLLAALRPHAGHELHGVYVDHGLRPQETGAEQRQVAEQARALGVGCSIVSVKVREHAALAGISEEHAARNLRYQALEQIACAVGASKIAVAHTADDQAEEVLLRLLRGTGRSGLAGMNAIRDGHIIRPLLSIDKARLLRYLSDKQIPYCEDSSNLQRKYLRNRVRHDLLPFLRRFNSGIDETLRRTAVILTDEEELLEHLTCQAWGKCAQLAGDVRKNAPEIRIDITELLALPIALRRRVTEKVFLSLGGVPDFNKINFVLNSALHGQGGAQLHFKQGLRMKKQGNTLVFSFPRGRGALRGNLDEEQGS